MADPFDSAWLKWGRAVTHAQALDADIKRFARDLNGQPLGTISHEYNPKRHGFVARLDTVDPLPPRWNLLLGDVVHNFRCTLDHVAWALVARGTTPNLSEQQARRVYFPISDSPTRFDKDIVTKLPGVRSTDLAIVRRYQPYRRGKTRAQWHCFALLEAMSNNDKHRYIQGLWMVPDRSDIEITEERDCIVTGTRHRGWRNLMQVGAETGFIRARKMGPNPHIEVKYNMTCYPAFHPRLWLGHWLDIATVETMLLLRKFAYGPSEVNELGIDPTRYDESIRVYETMAALWIAKTRGGTPEVSKFSI